MLIGVLGVLIFVVDSSGCNASGSFNFGYSSCWAMKLSTTLTTRVSSFISDCFFPLPTNCSIRSMFNRIRVHCSLFSWSR